MSFPVICRACGARLKLPPGCTKKKARCPKCDARIDLTAALNASAYLPTVASVPAAAPVREEDPLPYADLNPVARSRPQPPPLPPKSVARPPLASASDDAALSLDDETATPTQPPPQAAPPPFRVSACVTADSAGLFTGPCEVVLVPHGLFLESVPYRPFLHVPVRSRVDTPGRRGLAVTLPDGRTVTLEFTGSHGGQLADDTAAFLVGERGLPDPGEYHTTPRWLFLVAFVLALGLATGPLVLSDATDLGLEIGLLLAAIFAGVGLLANAGLVLFTRLSVPGKVALMSVVGVLVTGVFLFGATAYLAGRKHEAEQPKPEPQPPPQPPPKPPEPPPEPMPPEMPRRPPTASDKAYSDGVYRFEEGPDDVTALGVTADSFTLVIGYKNGTTRVWNFDQPIIDPFNVGPKCDGPPTRIEFDSTDAIVYMNCSGGTVAALWNKPPDVPLKIPGDSLVAFSFPKGDRFAAVRGNAIVLRYLPTDLIKKPLRAAKGFPTTLPKDEVVPADAKAPLNAPPQRPTFLAWHPTGKLLAGQPDGSILSWGASGPSYIVTSRDHKAAVRAWAASPSTWDFATGDDKGVVGLWENKAMKPRVFTAAPAAITQLVFSPSGTHLAVVDLAGGIRVWDLAAQRSILKVTRVLAKVAFGPDDDLLLLSDGKVVELWNVPELAKQP
jgi:WD40 repeat protein